MYQGSCLCGAIKYTLKSEPRKVSHCHCRMCQKQHGAAFATYCSLPKQDLVYEQGKELLTAFNSSSSIMRKFCRRCGSSIEWSGSPEYPEWTSIAVATLDTPFQADKVIDIYTDTKVCWLDT